MNACRIDVVVCTFNRADRISRLLSALSEQTLPSSRFRLLVVDDGSTDDTADVCRRMKASLPNLEYMRNAANLGLSNSRNEALRRTEAPLLLFIDDDCIPRPDWAEKMAEALEDAKIVAGAIESPTENFWQLCHNVAQFHPFLHSRKSGKSRFIAGANMGFHREVLLALKGFEPDRTTAEDMELVLRAAEAGFSVHFSAQAVVRHEPLRTSLSQIVQYSARHARQTIRLRRRFRTVLGSPRFVYAPAFLLLCAPGIALFTTIRIFCTDRVLLKSHPSTIPVFFILKLAWCVGACQGLLSRKGE